ncbi:MAG: haloacid dehalogenase-like hydrolase [Bacteroidota bacterium]
MSILEHPAIASFLREHANHSSVARPLAVFDCDGTVIRGDIGESMFYRQIEQFHFRRSPAELWTDHPERGRIDKLYLALAERSVDKLRQSPEFDEFAEILLAWYFGQIAAGKVIKACADIVRLFAGYSVDEIHGFAKATFEEQIAAPLGERRLGERTLPLGIRFLRETRDLLRELQLLHFDIWAVSGSFRWSVVPVFGALGVPADRVIGIELRTDNGVCTGEAVTPIPIWGGKIDALRLRTPSPPSLVASDSKNDLPLFRYSSGLKVRINSRRRSTDDFFRNAGITRDKSWVVVEEPAILDHLPHA